MDWNAGLSIETLKTSGFAGWDGTVATTISLPDRLDSRSSGSRVRKQQSVSPPRRPMGEWNISDSCVLTRCSTEIITLVERLSITTVITVGRAHPPFDQTAVAPVGPARPGSGALRGDPILPGVYALTRVSVK